MRILVLASYVPSLYKGAEIRLLHLLKNLSRQHEITLWAINRRGVGKEEIAALLPDCKLLLQAWPSQNRGGFPGRIFRSFWYRQLKDWHAHFGPKPTAVNKIYHPGLKDNLEALLEKSCFDLIHVNQIMVWQYLPPAINIPVILCKDNVWADLAEREWAAADGRMARYFKKQTAEKMRRYEGLAVKSSTRCVVVSHEDKTLIQQMAPETTISVIPNGVDTTYFRPSQKTAEAPHLVFTGTMSWLPNADAMIFFCNTILPLVRGLFPEVLVTIVGLHPPKEVRALAKDPYIRVTGFVEDVRPYIDEAAVYIVPLRSGSGTRLKILEALAMGKAVVSTRIGAAGLAVTDGRHILLADEPESFAEKICRLLKDPERRRALGRAGRTLVESVYDWKAVAAELDQVYHETVLPEA